MNPKTLDHVAYWLADRDAVADFVVRHLGMHVIDRTDAFTLVGADARRGKLTLFAADGPRERGALEHVALRVRDLDRALTELPDGLEVERRREGEAYFELAKALRSVSSRPTTDLDYDLDHVALRSADPQATASEYGSLGFRAAAPGRRAARGSRWAAPGSSSSPGEPGAPEQPLLNHLAVLVDSADEHEAAARDLGVEIDNVVDAAEHARGLRLGPGARADRVRRAQADVLSDLT